jgi:2-polyprenyl-6-methoxyphenol hydroxylase-like FAD-dependent oxidoreductase
MNDRKAPRILVVGAGIAGLSTAVALRRLGAHVEVVERKPHPDPAGTGLFIPANGMRAFAALGLGDALLGRGQVITRLRARSADGAVEGVADLAEIWPDLPACLAIHRVEVQRVLLDAADVPVRFGVSPSALSQPRRRYRCRSAPAPRRSTTWSSARTGFTPRSAP